MTDDVATIAAGLTKAQRHELSLVTTGDSGYLARGDRAGLVRAGLAKPPMGAGFYYLSRRGLAVRAYVQGQL